MWIKKLYKAVQFQKGALYALQDLPQTNSQVQKMQQTIQNPHIASNNTLINTGNLNCC